MNQDKQLHSEKSGANLGLHRFLLVLSLATVLLIVAGALVTSNDAGLSVPDWPTSFGSFRMPRMVGGVFYEHGHRMVAASIGFLTIIVTAWIFWRERRRWMRGLGLAALLAVILQGVLGGITVLYFLPPPVSTFHACLAQMFLCLIVSLAVFTSPSWNAAEWQLEDSEGVSVRTLSTAAVALIFLQLFLGAAFRHNWFNLIPHVVNAVLVAVIAFWTVGAVLRRFRGQSFLTRPAWVAAALLGAQLVLGPVAYFVLSASADDPQPMEPMVGVTVAHVAVGALTLAAMLVLTLRIYRVIAPRKRTAEQPSLAHSTTH